MGWPPQQSWFKYNKRRLEALVGDVGLCGGQSNMEIGAVERLDTVYISGYGISDNAIVHPCY